MSVLRSHDMQRVLICVLILTTCSCGRETEPDSAAGRLPYAGAPLDTIESDEGPGGDVLPVDRDEALPDFEWEDLTWSGLPSPGELPYVRYTNERFGYSIAYPDTLLTPDEPVGEDRGMTFISSSGDLRMMVYAMERDSYEDLAAQYRTAVEDPESRITYRTQDDDLYVVAGGRGTDAFYEKGVAGGGTITTFRMHYPAEDKAYFDALAALMSASLEP